MTAPEDPFAPPSQPGPGQSYGPPAWSGAPAYGSPPPGYGAAPGYGVPPVAGAPHPGWQPAPQTDGRAIAVLVLAITSFVVFPVIPAIVALVLAPGASRDIAASGGRLTGESLVRAGRIVAWVNLALVIGGILLLVLFVGALGVLVDPSPAELRSA